MANMDNYTLVKLDDLTPGEEVGFKNPRQSMDKKGIKELADSIAAHGLKNPIQVWRTKNEVGEEVLVLIGGHRRVAAIEMLINEERANGFSKGVPANISDDLADLKAAKIDALVDNVQREQLSSYEIATECQQLKELGETGKSIAKQINKSESWVSRKLSILTKGTPELIEAWRDGKITDDDAEKIVEKVKDPETQNKTLKDVLEVETPNGNETPRDKKTKKRKKVAEAAGRAVKPGTKDLRMITISLSEGLDKASLEKKRYTKGVYDAIRFAMGEIPMGKLDGEFKETLKAIEKAAKDKAKEDAKAAKDAE